MESTTSRGCICRIRSYGEDAPREQVKAIDERITKLMAGLNQRVKDLKKEARRYGEKHYAG